MGELVQREHTHIRVEWGGSGAQKTLQYASISETVQDMIRLL